MALIPNEPRKRNAILLVLVALAGAYVFHEYWYQPRALEVEELEERLENLQNQNRQAQVVAARGGAELEERLAIYERHVARLEELIPESEEVPGLLRALNMEAQRMGVELASMHPEPAMPGEHYTTQTYELSVVGEYHDVGRYLAAVASLPRIITPIDLELAPFTQASGQNSDAPVVAHFRVRTYVIPSRPGDLMERELHDIPDLDDPLEAEPPPDADPEEDPGSDPNDGEADEAGGGMAGDPTSFRGGAS